MITGFLNQIDVSTSSSIFDFMNEQPIKYILIENSNPMIRAISIPGISDIPDVELAKTTSNAITNPIVTDKNMIVSKRTSQDILIRFKSIFSILISPSLNIFIASILFFPESVVDLTILLKLIISL